MAQEKTCTKCGYVGDNFPPSHCWCRVCLRESYALWAKKNPERAYLNSRNSYDRTKYGAEEGYRERLLAEQNGACAICGIIPKTRRGLHLDHNHTTKELRGLLCHGCNTALGGFSEDREVLRAALDYLIAWGV